MDRHFPERSIASRGSLYHSKQCFNHRQVQRNVMADYNRASDFVRCGHKIRYLGILDTVV